MQYNTICLPTSTLYQASLVRDKKTQRPRGKPLVAFVQMLPVGVAVTMAQFSREVCLVNPWQSCIADRAMRCEDKASLDPAPPAYCESLPAERARERGTESRSHTRSDVQKSCRRHGVCVDRTQEDGGSKYALLRMC